ncbi:MAG TPA: hypothetical protein V6D22_17000 [Candidatus Obscuribacterales bacterium]
MNLSEQFAYRKPTDDETTVMKSLSDAAGALAKTCELAVTSSAERTLALRKLQEFRMWINAAIIFGGLVKVEVPELNAITGEPGTPITGEPIEVK